MKNKIITYIILFAGAIFFIDLLNSILIKHKISNVKYSYQEINKFTLIGKSDTDFYLKGDKLKEFEDKIFIYPFNLVYIKDGKEIYVNSKEGVYFKGKSILKLIDNVHINRENIDMFTKNMIVYTDKNTAETFEDVLIKGGNMETFGKGAFIDMNKENIKVFNVKSIIK